MSNVKFPQNIKAIFFDRGNTTHNCLNGPPEEEKDAISITALTEAINRKFSLAIELEEVLKEIVNPWSHTFRDRDSRGYEVKLEDYLISFLKNRNITRDSEAIETVIRIFAEPLSIWDIPNEGIAELFKDLKGKGYFIGILSNSTLPGYVFRDIYRLNGLDRYIDDYLFSYDLPWRKPDRRIFDYACEKNRLNPGECVMVGDKPAKDIVGARNAGMRTIFYNFRRQSIDHGADWEISHFKEIADKIGL